ncbi:hypothetical protein NQ318_012202, partial [Aromia moschata]
KQDTKRPTSNRPSFVCVGYEWVGWRNDTPGWAGHPLEMLFEFEKVRNFSATHLHTNNLFTKDVQVFSHARAFFSLNGHIFSPEPVHFSYMPDLILEHSRNVTIKLHHRIGRYLKLQLYFASRWILLSEVSFDSVLVTGNFTETEEDAPVPDSGREYPLQRDEVQSGGGAPKASGVDGGAGTGHSTKAGDADDEPKHYIGFVIGVLTVVIFILVAAIVFIVFRNQRLKATTGVSTVPTIEGDLKRFENEKMTTEDGDKTTLYVESCRPSLYSRQTHPTSPDYSEVPDLVCQDYVSPTRHLNGSTVEQVYAQTRAPPPILNFLPKPPPVPPPPDGYYLQRDVRSSLPLSPSPPLSTPTVVRSRSKVDNHFMLPLSPEPEDDDDDVFEEDRPVERFPREKLRIVEKIGEGLFGDVHLCEVLFSPDGPYGGECKFVVVHNLRADTFREEFAREVRALARLRDCNVARLLGACLDSEPVCAVREYAPLGDLCQFLQDHVAETATPLAPTASTLSYGCLIYMATQIASGMKYLESLKYVHKDLAARNCLVGRRYEIKVSDLGSYRQMYSADYCQIAGSRPLPVRWMAWETVLLRQPVIGFPFVGNDCCANFHVFCDKWQQCFGTSRVIRADFDPELSSSSLHFSSFDFDHSKHQMTFDESSFVVSSFTDFRRIDFDVTHPIGNGSTRSGDFIITSLIDDSVVICFTDGEQIRDDENFGKYSSKSDVWSFAVLLWEILTFAREQPFEELSDDGVVENVTHFYQNDGKHILLSAPINCPKEIFDLMCECWQRNESDRPNFREIHLFLQRKNLGYHPDLH